MKREKVLPKPPLYYYYSTSEIRALKHATVQERDLCNLQIFQPYLTQGHLDLYFRAPEGWTKRGVLDERLEVGPVNEFTNDLDEALE